MDDEISVVNIDFNHNNTLLDEESKKLAPLRDKKMESAASLQKLNLDMSNLVQEEVLKFEPHGALFSNNRGIEDIDQIIKSAKRVLKPGGYLIIENGYDQSNEVIRILRQEDYGDIKVLMDYNNISRFTSSRKK